MPALSILYGDYDRFMVVAISPTRIMLEDLHILQCAGTAVAGARCSLKNGVFWVVTPCGSCKNRRFGGT
jgi:hypothetical protein